MLALPISISILTMVVGGSLGMAHGRQLFSKGFRLTGNVRVRECPLIPVCLLAFVALHVLTAAVIRDPGIWWSLPVFIEYHLTLAMWVVKGLFAAFAMAAIVTVGYIQRYPKRLLLLLFSIAVLITIDSLTRKAVQPNLGIVKNTVKDGVVHQSNPSTCAAATAANIARYYGIEATESDMVERLHTTWAGTSPSQLVYGFRALGLTATKVNIPDLDLTQVRPPAVLLVAVGGETDAHAVAYMGQVENQFEIWDPSSGRRVLSPAQVATTWGGRAIEVGQRLSQ